jgi:hypothetical protein
MFRNREIDTRNDARERAALAVANPRPLLASKISTARQLGEKKLITQVRGMRGVRAMLGRGARGKG